MTILSITVTHHPSRAEWLAELLEDLGPFGKTARVCSDPGKSGSWPTTKRSWSDIPEDADYHMVIEDDVVVCKDFVVGMKRAIRHRPAAIIAPYSAQWGTLAQEAYAAGRSWVQIPGKMSGQCICMPAVWARRFIPWHESWLPPYEDTDFWVKKHGCVTEYRRKAAWCNWSDWRVRMFAKTFKLPIWFTVPSLVDHRGFDSGVNPGGNAPTKRAQIFIGRDRSALEVDWSKR